VSVRESLSIFTATAQCGYATVKATGRERERDGVTGRNSLQPAQNSGKLGQVFVEDA
jgi:hypothetical protein